MPYTHKIVVTLPNGSTTLTYYATGAPDETSDPTVKKFTGIKSGMATDGSEDGTLTIYKSKILDQYVRSGSFSGA